VLTAGSNSLDELALYIALKGVDFEVQEPPELGPTSARSPSGCGGPSPSHPAFGR
jgi:hypothetical protein